MEVMISINPPYTDMVFTGYKPFEFRKKVLKGMNEGYPLEDITAYIYETKNKGGVGAVIGEVKIDGAYTPNYGKDSKTDTYVEERYRCVRSLYLIWCEKRGAKPNLKEGWFKSKRFLRYQEEIGFVPELDFNYALILGKPKKYANPLPLNAFVSAKGDPLIHPPQNMFRVRCNPGFLTVDSNNKTPLPNAGKTGVWLWQLGFGVPDGQPVEYPCCPFCSTAPSVDLNHPLPTECPICGAALMLDDMPLVSER